jgi:hypothetical protein
MEESNGNQPSITMHSNHGNPIFPLHASLAKLIPKDGSGRSGGTSSGGKLTFHDSSTYPYKHKLPLPEK